MIRPSCIVIVLSERSAKSLSCVTINSVCFCSWVNCLKISNTKSRVKRLVFAKNYLKASVGITTIALLLVFVFPENFYVELFGAGFEQAKIVSLGLMPGAFFMSMYYVTSSYFSGIGKFQYNNIAILLGLAITLIGGFVFIPTGGIVTAALVTSAAFTAIALFSLFFFIKELKR